MRCPKCGYNSFDYLSECGKCQADLSKVRQELGFSSVRPTMPAWLGSLVGDRPQSARGEEAGQAAATDLDDLLQASIFTADGPPELILEDLSQPAEAADEPIEFDLDDADLPLLAGVGGKSGDAPAAVASPAAEETLQIGVKAEVAPPPSAEMTIDLSDDLHDWSLLDLQMDEGDEPVLSEPHGAGDTAEESLVAASPVKPGRRDEDETIIELSEQDLEGLLLELEGGGKGNDET